MLSEDDDDDEVLMSAALRLGSGAGRGTSSPPAEQAPGASGMSIAADPAQAAAGVRARTMAEAVVSSRP